ncbi:MAG: CRISPR-associated helicase Cas3' [Candidatus Bathyarchaeota archaeon]|nr:CRISPR-associated helicase Cas3' [Candidatus Termiticorpusculum sp.]
MIEQSKILAKDTGETLSEHTLRCIAVAENIVENLPFEDDILVSIKSDLISAIAVHDVGKAAVGFQKSLLPDAKRWGHRHEIISAAFASFQKLKPEVIFAVLTHHRTIPAGWACSGKGCLDFAELPFATSSSTPPSPYPVWFQMENEWKQNISSFVNEWNQILKGVKSNKLSSQIGLDYSSFTYDWIDRGKQTSKISFNSRLYAATLRGLLMSCDHIGSSGVRFAFPKMPDFSKLNITVPYLFNFQKKAGEINGNLILQAPTGSGKTLAALLWVRRNQKRNGRLFYTLPNTASINAMYLRLCKDFGQATVGLLHSRASSSLYSILENEEYSSLVRQKEARMAKKLSRELWYPIRVCTPHQILRYTLHGKGWELMLSEFPNACFVFDEIHAYDPIITGFIIATAKLVCDLQASCLFLSATMPTFLKKLILDEIAPKPFLFPNSEDEIDSHILNKQRHNLQIQDGTILTNIDLILKTLNESKSTLIVCNHVPSAQKVFDEIQKRGIKDSLLLHSRFCKRDRNKIEKVIQSQLPKVLVATQVVEVSLDVDFEQGFFEPAPIDAIIQRLGRVNRKCSRPPANVIVFKEQIASYNIYSKDIVDRSLGELEHLSNPLSESDLVNAADQIYQGGYCGEDLQQYTAALNHPLIKKFKEYLVAGCHNDWTKDVIDKSDGTIDLLPSSLKSEYQEALSSGLWLEADQLLVQVRTNSLSYLIKDIDTNSDPWVIKKPYSFTHGLCLSSIDRPE